jgi:3-hydroxyacyl-[acyl-carrier-protein] dehydratase
MPGVMIVEAMAQTAGALVMYSMNANAADKLVYFMAIDKARFRHPVVPGDLLRIPVKLQRARAPVWRFTGEAYVDGRLCAEAEYSAMIMDKAGRPTTNND